MYVQPDDVRGVLARDDASAGHTAASLGDAEMAAVITSAQTEVDSKLAARYTVPFPDGQVPRLVAEVVRDIAAYLADLRFRQGKDYESERDPVLLRHKRAQELLAEIVAGRVDLPVPPGSQTTSGVMRPRNPYRGRLFTMGDFGLGPGTPRRR